MHHHPIRMYYQNFQTEERKWRQWTDTAELVRDCGPIIHTLEDEYGIVAYGMADGNCVILWDIPL